MWLILEYTPIGPYLYSLRQMPRACRTEWKFPTHKFVCCAFGNLRRSGSTGGVLRGFEIAHLGQAALALNISLPALVGAFLGLHHNQTRTGEVLGHHWWASHSGSLAFPAFNKLVVSFWVETDVSIGVHLAGGDWHRAVTPNAEKGACKK